MNGILIVKLSSCRMRYTLQFMKSAAALADRRALKLPRISLCAPSDFILATTLTYTWRPSWIYKTDISRGYYNIILCSPVLKSVTFDL